MDKGSAIALSLGAVALLAYVAAGDDLLGFGHSVAEAAVAAELRDPSSAQFRNFMEGTTATCGEVNGKNGFGAYSGFKRFVYANGKVLFEPESPAVFEIKQQTDYYWQTAEFARNSQLCYK